MAKTDTYGLGYEPFRNAPEFASFHTQRQKRIQRRVQAAMERDGRKRWNVYRTDDLYGGSGGGNGEEVEEEEEDDNRTERGKEGGRGPLAPETHEDFIGTRTTAGFALNDDDDDVYDDDHHHPNEESLLHKGRTACRSMVVVDGTDNGSGGGGGGDGISSATEAIRKSGRYCDVAYETDESSDGDAAATTATGSVGGGGGGGTTATNTNRKTTNPTNGLAAVLGAWAENGVGTPTTTNNKNGAPSVTKTFDGRLPLSGFHLQNNNNNNHTNNHHNTSSQKRWVGPDVPLSYQITRHVFREGDGTLKIGELSAALARVQRNDRRDGTVGGGGGRGGNKGPLTATTTTNKTNNSAAFLRLSDALKQRFARSGETVGGSSSSAGKTNVVKVEYDLTSKRTRMAWHPSPLLLKRFRVGAVTGSRGGTVDRAGAGAGVGGTATGTKKAGGGAAEEAFFRNLSSSLGVVTSNERSGGGGSNSTANVENEFVPLRPGNDYGDTGGSDIDGIGGTVPPSRPTTETMRAIFEPDSEDDEMDISSSSSEEEKEDGTKESHADAATTAMVESILRDGAAAAASAVGRGVVTPLSYPSTSLPNDAVTDGKNDDKKRSNDDGSKSRDAPKPVKQLVTEGNDQRDGTPIKANKDSVGPNINNGKENRRYRRRRSTDSNSSSSSSSSSSDDDTSKRHHRRRRHRRPTKDHKKDKTRDRRRRRGSRDNTNDDGSNNSNDDSGRQRRLRQRRTTKDRKKDRKRDDRRRRRGSSRDLNNDKSNDLPEGGQLSN